MICSNLVLNWIFESLFNYSRVTGSSLESSRSYLPCNYLNMSYKMGGGRRALIASHLWWCSWIAALKGLKQFFVHTYDWLLSNLFKVYRRFSHIRRATRRAESSIPLPELGVCAYCSQIAQLSALRLIFSGLRNLRCTFTKQFAL